MCMANKKEVHYFDNDANFSFNNDYSSYHQHFSCADKKIIGEATPIYLYKESCLPRIYTYNPSIKLIILLRNPIARAYSHWNMECNRGREGLPFRQALLAETQRAKVALPAQDSVHSYIDRGFYSQQIRRVWRFFDKSQVLILKQENLQQHLDKTLNRVTQFLNISDFPPQEKKTVHGRTYQKSLGGTDFNYLKNLYFYEIKEIEKLLGWDCSNWLDNRETILFHRDFINYTGGHQKVFDYFEHTNAHGNFNADIIFSRRSRWDESNPWFQNYRICTQVYDPDSYNILFVAGMDWDVIAEGVEERKTVINLIQGFRHADKGSPLYSFLKRKAIRVCVSQQVADAIAKTGQVNGEILTIANGHRLPALVREKSNDIFILGKKNIAFAQHLERHLKNIGLSVINSIQHLPRDQVFQYMAASKISVLLPLFYEKEGFYLPALEAMKYSDLAIVPDCGGNKSFCVDNQNCLMPDYTQESFLVKIKQAIEILGDKKKLTRIKQAAKYTLEQHSIERERQDFFNLLTRLTGRPKTLYKNIILTGVPRSGSSLVCSLLSRFDNTLALLEPMPVFEADPAKSNVAACRYVMDFIFGCRHEILYKGKVQTSHYCGKEGTNTFEDSDAGSLRSAIIKNSKVAIDCLLEKDFTLAIKHTAFFRAILKDLVNFFDCYATIRNPLSILASWQTIRAPINQGHAPAGERFDRELAQKLRVTPSVLSRQLILLNWFFQGFWLYLDNEQILKYEDIISSNGNRLAPLSYSGKEKADFEPLLNRNVNSQYLQVDIDTLYNTLMNSDGAYWHYYTREDVDRVYESMKHLRTNG